MKKLTISLEEMKQLVGGVNGTVTVLDTDMESVAAPEEEIEDGPIDRRSGTLTVLDTDME